MAKLRVHNFSISLDGYGAGPRQSVDEPLGVDGESLHEWMFVTRGWHEYSGEAGGSEGVDNDFFNRGFDDIGAHILGRNMSGPIRGEWGDTDWRGWWGEEPPYHTDVFVLTHHAREPVPMAGGTTFYFVTDGIENALERAFTAAGGKDVRLGGGASTIQQYMRAGLLDDLHLAIVPILLGGGERLFDNLDAGPRYECVEFTPGDGVAHARLAPKR
jgi:dihydrofolate reductase